MNTEEICLSGTQSYITRCRTDAFGVSKGSVCVYIATWDEKENKPGRRAKVCEVPEGKAFPALFHRDAQQNSWCFIVVPQSDSAELKRFPYAATKVLKRSMAQRAMAPNYEYDSFENSMIELYKLMELREKVKLLKKLKDEEENDAELYQVADYAVGGYGMGVMLESGEPLYDALSFLCRKGHIPLEEWSELKPKIGSEVTAPKIAEAAHLICRKIDLNEGWYRGDCGLILAMLDDTLIALAPGRANSYTLYNTRTKKEEKLTESMLKSIHPHAYSISRTLPQRSLDRKDIISFVLGSIDRFDVARVILLGVLTAVAGVLLPLLNQKIYDDYIPMGDFDMVRTMCLVTGTFMLGNLTFTLGKKLSEYRISVRTGHDMQSAVYQRLFELPERFFRSFDSADLAQRVVSFGDITSQMVTQFITTSFSVVMLLVYMIQMFAYSSKFALFGILMLLVCCAAVYLISCRTLKYDAEIADLDGKARGKLYQYIEGIDKIRLAGAESSALLGYMNPFADRQKAAIRKNWISTIGNMIMESSGTVFSMVLYFIIVRSILSGDHAMQTGAFVAFNTAFGGFSSSAMELVHAVLAYRSIKPMFERIKPILDEVPETAADLNGSTKTMAGKLSGRIDLEGVTFSYDKGADPVICGMSLSIHPGEYVGIVGSSGCGKSTLLKLLLGFETPSSGCIRYDGQDLEMLDKRSVRKQIGTVLQNGRLIAGSIYENISITAESPTMDEVKQAVRAAGLEKDVEEMPMKLQTLLSEANNSISGGQRQRILIARALCGKPSILLFDEATSALDNITQDIVCKNLDTLQITRIVIAHRLSTIQKCSRILVMDHGRIIQDGSYEQLMQNKEGMFYQLASRQLAESMEEKH